MQKRDTIDRRTFVRLGTAASALALAGCAGLDDTDEEQSDDDGETGPDDTDGGGNDGDEDDVTAPELIEVEDPPAAVYVPTHREAMRMLETVEAGDVRLAPMLSYPHPFWVIAGGGTGGDEVERVPPEDGRGVHMMFTLWDAETDVVLPVDEGAQLRVFQDGEQVGSPRSPWAMISQGMGFHFGDNVPLPADGTYTVEVTVPPISTAKTGDLDGRLDEGRTATFEFEYDDEFRDEVIDGVEYFDEEIWGEEGAIEPMQHGLDNGDDHDGGEHDGMDRGEGHDDDHVPYSALPRVDEYPGTRLVDPDGEDVEETADLPRSGDAAVLATVFEPESRLADGDERYLLVSPRTPYNRVPLADMSLRATVERDGEVVSEQPLEQTLDGEYGLHYGLSTTDIEPGDSVTIEIESPPQVARHQGYETAFLDMSPVELTVPEGV